MKTIELFLKAKHVPFDFRYAAMPKIWVPENMNTIMLKSA